MIRLNKKEKEIFERVIDEELQKDKNVSSLKVLFYIRSKHGQRRHHQTKQWDIVKRMMKKKKKLKLKFGERRTIKIVEHKSHDFPNAKGMKTINDNVDCPLCKAGLKAKQQND